MIPHIDGFSCVLWIKAYKECEAEHRFVTVLLTKPRRIRNERSAPYRLDVGIDATGLFRPLALEEVVAKLIGEPE